MGSVFLKVLSVFSMIAIGIIANKTKRLPDEASPHLIKLLINVTTPSMLISSLAGQSFSPELISEVLIMLVASFAAFIIMIAASFLLTKLLHYPDRRDNGILTVLLCANNVGFMGFAVAKAVFNDRILFFAVIFNILASIHVFAVTPLQMQYGSNEPVKRGNILASLLNLPIIATFTGLFFLFTPLSLPKFVFDTFDLLGSANLPLSMIIIGIQLGGSNLMKVIKNYKLTIAALIKVIVMPLIIFLATLPMPISSEMKLTLVFLNALPSAVVEAAIAEENGKNYRLLAEGIMLTTAISIITLPIICSLIGSYYGIV